MKGDDAAALVGTTHMHTRLLVTALNDGDGSPKSGLPVRFTIEFGSLMGNDEMAALLGPASVPDVIAAVARAVEAIGSSSVTKHLGVVAAELLRERERVIRELTDRASRLLSAVSLAHECLTQAGVEPPCEDGSLGPLAAALAVLDKVLETTEPAL